MVADASGFQIGSSPGELAHMERLLGIADDNFVSWAYWQLKKYNDFTTANAAEALYAPNGTLEVAKLKALSRTYAQAIAGVPLKMSFDPSTALFELHYNATILGAPTEVYMNKELYYSDGFQLTLKPEGCMSAEFIQPRFHIHVRPQCFTQIMIVRLTAG